MTKTVTRYVEESDREGESDMHEDPNGAWVRYEDIKHLLHDPDWTDAAGKRHRYKCGLNPDPAAVKHMVAHCTCPPGYGNLCCFRDCDEPPVANSQWGPICNTHSHRLSAPVEPPAECPINHDELGAAGNHYCFHCGRALNRTGEHL